jgi:hypothetical protein
LIQVCLEYKKKKEKGMDHQIHAHGAALLAEGARKKKASIGAFARHRHTTIGYKLNFLLIIRVTKFTARKGNFSRRT